METQTLDDPLQLQQTRIGTKLQYTRVPPLRQSRDERRDKRILESKNTMRMTMAPNQVTAIRTEKESEVSDTQKARRDANTERAANPFENAKPLKGIERGSAPSRGGDDLYKGNDQDRLFDGGGRRAIPEGLRKKATEESDEPGRGDKLNGEGGGDDSGDDNGGDDDFLMMEEVDEDDDDGLSGYVDAEDDAAYVDWLIDDHKSNGKSLSKGDFLKLRDTRWAEIQKQAEDLNDQEDQEWLEETTKLANSFRPDTFQDAWGDMDKAQDELVARLLYQPSKRIRLFQADPVVKHLEKCVLYPSETPIGVPLEYEESQIDSYPYYDYQVDSTILSLATISKVSTQTDFSITYKGTTYIDAPIDSSLSKDPPPPKYFSKKFRRHCNLLLGDKSPLIWRIQIHIDGDPLVPG